MPDPLLSVSGIVLAGGRSSRFGSDKLVMPIDGVPLLHHALAAIAQACSEVIVVAGPAGLATASLRDPPNLPMPLVLVRDPVPFPGPLAALITAARQASGERLLLVAGDMPTLVPAVLRRLSAWSSGHVGARLDTGEGPLQPIPIGLDRQAILRAAPALIAGGSRSLRAMLPLLDLELVPETEWRVLDPEATSLRDIDRLGDVPADPRRRPG
jgi:molybdopterin-guanine dinucleotide biosynthesis protein A